MKIQYKVTFYHIPVLQQGIDCPASINKISHGFHERSWAVDWILKTKNDFAGKGYYVNECGDFTNGKDIVRWTIEQIEKENAR